MNLVDIGVVGVIAFSAILALMRGLVSEVLSVGGWVGAALATLYAFPRLQPYMRAHVEPAVLADGMAIVGVFVLSLVVLSVIAHEISKGVRDSALSAVDRSLGLLFGVARGALLVCLAWMLVAWLVPGPDQPQWLRDSKTRPFAETGAAWLQALVPAQVRSDAATQADALAAKARQTMQDAEALRRLTTPKPETPQPAQPPAEGAYKKQDRGELDRLIRNAN
ncbi:MAG: CvpA family protein [Rhodospirillaceae bacterium]